MLSLIRTVVPAFVLSTGLVFLAACNSKPSQTETASKPGGGHAAAHVEPGSYEDWCDEHAVPESMCTRCNPALSAAFKATGDWCQEHGLPESQCRICNPNLKIERPQKKAH